jgi:hypothetical protein
MSGYVAHAAVNAPLAGAAPVGKGKASAGQEE